MEEPYFYFAKGNSLPQVFFSFFKLYKMIPNRAKHLNMYCPIMIVVYFIAAFVYSRIVTSF